MTSAFLVGGGVGGNEELRTEMLWNGWVGGGC
jgi:hypothetical protein